MEKYSLFIDDSGLKEYIDDYNRDSLTHPELFDREFWLRNYFVIAGILLRNSAIPMINRRLVDIKTCVFSDPAVEIKSGWLRNSNCRQEHYIDPYGISPEDLDYFGNQVTNCFCEFRNNLEIVACVFDKRYYKKRGENDPFCNACQLVLERAQFSMQKRNGRCLIVADQMESQLSSTRGRNGDFVDVLHNERSMSHVFVDQYKNIEGINFRRSCDENLIQLADIAAYNIYRQFVDFGRDWEKTEGELRYYRYFELIKDNFLKVNDRAVGNGLSKLPDPQKNRWF